MRWKTILRNSTLGNNLFMATLSYNKTDPDGSPVTYSFSVNIPDTFAIMYSGDRKVPKWLKNDYKEAVENNDLESFYNMLTAYVLNVADNYKYKWGALLESNTLYFNPLWNVDGVTITEEDRAKRTTTFDKGAQSDSTQYGQKITTDSYGNGTDYTRSMKYGQDETTTKHGNNQAYTESTQYGQDQSTSVTGARGGSSTHKTNPFNDSDTLYSTDKTETTEDSATDTVTRTQHTDTVTHNPYTDVETRGQRTDTETIGAHEDQRTEGQHTDAVTSGARTDKTEDAAYKDVVTVTRQGNIGVTKSTELLRDYRDLATELYAPILNDFMHILSWGY